jgi:hypothetical protein
MTNVIWKMEIWPERVTPHDSDRALQRFSYNTQSGYQRLLPPGCPPP